MSNVSPIWSRASPGEFHDVFIPFLYAYLTPTPFILGVEVEVEVIDASGGVVRLFGK